MTPSDLATRLRELATASPDDFSFDVREVTSALEAAGADRAHLLVIFEFMEQHPGLDLGSPGPLVHFIESAFRDQYEVDLIASIRRTPTMYTLWMMNRIANSRSTEGRRATLALYREVEARTDVSAQLRQEAKDYRERFERLDGTLARG